jgi:hypothetical protein
MLFRVPMLMGLEIEVFAEADRGDHAFDRVGEGDPHDQAVVEEVVVQIEGHVEQVKAVFEVFGKISARERDLDGGTDPGPLRAHVDVDLPLRPLGHPGLFAWFAAGALRSLVSLRFIGRLGLNARTVGSLLLREERMPLQSQKGKGGDENDGYKCTRLHTCSSSNIQTRHQQFVTHGPCP